VPLWKNIRRLAFTGAAQGVLNPGPLDVLTPMQSVQLTDDASRLAAPPRILDAMAGADVSGVAGIFSGVEIKASAGGIWLDAFALSGVTNNPFSMWRDDAQALVSTVAANIATWGPTVERAPLSRIQGVRVAAIPADALVWDQSNFMAGALREIRLFIPPGQALYMANTTANGAIAFFLRLREVPTQEVL
jgi:hypothetical protein